MKQVAVVLALAVSGGCATIAHGTRQTVTVTSDPGGASVTILSRTQDGQEIVRSTPGVTPITLELTRRDPNRILRLQKDDCSPVDVPLKRTVSGWTAMNLVFANPMAIQGYSSSEGIAAKYAGQLAVAGGTMAVDFLSGGAYKLPKAIDVPLCRQAAVTLPSSR